VRLLHRSAHGLSLTDEGRTLLVHARKLPEAGAEWRSEVNGKTGRPVGRVRVGVSAMLAQALIAPSLPKLMRRHPRLQLDVAIRTGTPQSDALVARQTVCWSATCMLRPPILSSMACLATTTTCSATAWSPILRTLRSIVGRGANAAGPLASSRCRATCAPTTRRWWWRWLSGGVGIARIVDLVARPLVSSDALAPLSRGPRHAGTMRADSHVGKGQTVDRIDALVIGAGVVGLAAGRALAQAGLQTIVVEAADGIGTGVSSRNSEVIHAGLYYTPGSHKAQLCVRGKELLYGLCASHGVPHAACGKLVVATETDQHAALAGLQQRAAANGVPAQMLTAAEARALEPELHCTQALWSPTTGIVDSHALMLALQGDLERAGGQLALQSPVRGASFRAGRPAVVQVGADGDAFEIEADRVVNAASLHACSLARAFEGLEARHVPQPRFAKGSYFTLAGRTPFRHLVYPAPVDAWLGVHVTLDLAGQARFGPDLQWLDIQTPEQVDYRVEAERARPFEAAIRRYWPGLPDGALVPGYSGVRPKIHGPGEPAPDFRIDGPLQHGVAGLVNLFGVESPGLTSALAIGERVAALLP